ncbi:MAG: 3-deoxy-manno-octulosonate cytidylyltransferase [Deltaproteobacteria bacterium]|jgi:3-deoxy-manno-octulosonate cytidylyltransferase (CMP-KDO synthetase)|nr:3-deoxy-manno-octulosonate cytidylyltransferase [Deltaproteobacteria bacterium]MCW9049622.1 3-deoxy-manno-octulosonate cytidylyltransferase [Deltaproteobacteria bacterium]
MEKAVAIIPARYGSTRFPGKPLALINGLPMIQQVYQRVIAANSVARAIVATDDERIVRAVESFGGEVMLTRADHPTGTDRLAEIAGKIDADLIVNVQGDEPLIDPRMIDQAVAPLVENPVIRMGTVASQIEEVDDFYNPNVVKVVLDQSGFALYFSRAPIPWPRDLNKDQLPDSLPQLGLLRHIGLYVYRRELLLNYPFWPKTPLESLESLEQLRALELGVKLHVAVSEFSCHGVDTPADLERISRLMS